VPKPWQSGQAPYGLLKLKSLGSISGKLKEHFGQENFADKICSV